MLEKKTTTGRKPTTRKKPEVKVLSGSVTGDLEFKSPKDYILSLDVTDIDVADVVIPKGYILLFCPISTNNAILTAVRYPEGEQLLVLRHTLYHVELDEFQRIQSLVMVF